MHQNDNHLKIETFITTVMQYHHNNNHHLHCSGCFPGYRIDSSHFCLNKCFGDKWHQMFWGQVIPVLYGLDALLVTQATASRCWRKLSNTDQHQEKLPALYLCSSNTRLHKKRCCSLHTCFLTPLCQSLYIYLGTTEACAAKTQKWLHGRWWALACT